MLLPSALKVLLVTGMARIKQTASLIEGSLCLTFFYSSFSTVVNIMQTTRSVDREVGASAGQPEGDAPQVE